MVNSLQSTDESSKSPIEPIAATLWASQGVVLCPLFSPCDVAVVLQMVNGLQSSVNSPRSEAIASITIHYSGGVAAIFPHLAAMAAVAEAFLVAMAVLSHESIQKLEVASHQSQDLTGEVAASSKWRWWRNGGNLRSFGSGGGDGGVAFGGSFADSATHFGEKCAIAEPSSCRNIYSTKWSL